jgi:iron complex transport system substrate-binding protein
MRGFACILAASIGLAATAAPAAAPRRVVSLNLCTDELVLMLADPGQIASVTHLARSPAESTLWRQARRHRGNDGSLLSVAGLRPDLVLTMGGGARDRTGIAGRLGIHILDLPYPQSIGDIEASVRTVAGAVGRPKRGHALLAGIDALKRGRPPGMTDTIWLGGGGRSMSPNGLGAQWLGLAGLKQRALPGDMLTLEQLLVRPPALLVRSNYRAGQYSGEQRWLRHPLAARPRGTRTIATDGRPWTCMGPTMVAEIARLRAEAGK